jgi:putative ABC transport system substrate-binding protein
VFQGVGDPVGAGFVKTLAHPGGNLTGLTDLTVELSPKLLELLLTIAPKLSRVAVLVNPSVPIQTAMVKSLQSASEKLGVNVLPIEARDPIGIEAGFGRMRRERAEAVIVLGDVIFWLQRGQIAELASRNRIPSMFALREHVESGGLMSYGQNSIEPFRRAATYVARILNGARPTDLPVEQSTKFELVINLKTAKALGLDVPNELLLRADEVIR